LKQPARRVLRRLESQGHFLKEIFVMEVAQQIRHGVAKTEVRSREMTIILGYSLLAVLMLMAIVVAFGGPGVSPEDLASMTVFP
jgi:hypothetical protein